MTQTNKRAGDDARTPACCDLEPLLDPLLHKALSDRNRLTLLSQLAASPRPRTVSELEPCCPVDLSVVSRHLSQLRDAGVVRSVKRGRQVFYQLCCDDLAQSLRRIADALDACAARQATRQEVA